MELRERVIIRVGRLRRDRGVSVARPTALGNPFELSQYERAESIARYRAWLPTELETNPKAQRQMDGLFALVKLVGEINLLCWCRSVEQSEPQCHADVIADYLRERLAEDPRDNPVERFAE